MSNSELGTVTMRAPRDPARILGGVLQERINANVERLLLEIDVEQFESAYSPDHPLTHAEPEFAGHYIDAALAAARWHTDPRLRPRAERVAEIIRAGQRADGFLGGLPAGSEFSPLYSVWNQQFSIMGLLLLHQETGDEAVLASARRCADYLIENFGRSEGPDLFDAINQGVEHSCSLLEFVRLFEVTSERRYLDFAEWIVARGEAGGMRLIAGTESAIPRNYSWLMVGSLKGLEILLCYRGLLRLANVTGNDRYAAAVVRYWESVRTDCIGPTGNGSIFELWTQAAAQPAEFPTEVHPFENCVAVGWMQISWDLFQTSGDVHYLHEYERTLFNHLLGSQARDGSDFSYYQGNVGEKVHATSTGLYSCCRYRGMTMLTQIPGHVLAESEGAVTVALYVESDGYAEVGGSAVTVRQRTDYPRSGRISLEIDPPDALDFTLRLRIPLGTHLRSLRVAGMDLDIPEVDGFLAIRREWRPGDRVDLDLELAVTRTDAVIAGRPAILTTVGPLVLAVDSQEGSDPDRSLVFAGETGELEPRHPDDWSRIVRYRARGRSVGRDDGVTLVDYATAGSLAPRTDRFRIWVTAESHDHSEEDLHTHDDFRP